MMGRIKKKYAVIAAATVVVAAIGGIITLASVTSPNAPPSYATVMERWTPSEAYLYDRHGRLIHERRTDYSMRRLAWVPLDAISPALQTAIVQAEDRRFRDHSGIDWKSVAAATWQSLNGDRRRGASTITMQLASMLDADLRSGGGRSILQKIQQARTARQIERTWSKEQILEAYFNLLGFRSELQGIAATAQLLLGKDPSGLNATESLMLAALLPSPGARVDRVARRACALNGRIGLVRDQANPDNEILACDILTPRIQELMTVATKRPARPLLAPHVAASLLKEPGAQVHTTLDRDIQLLAVTALKRRLSDLQHLNARDGAALVVDNESGDILAYVGSGGPHSRAPKVDGVRARRQAGSTLKPFLYGMAIEQRYLTAASILDDAPINLETVGGLYVPQNYDRDFKGLVSVRTALGNSLNIPAVRSLILTGVEPFRSRLQAAGYHGINRDGEFYGYALALGSADVTLMEQVAAYRMLARGGVAGDLRLQNTAVRNADRVVMAPGAVYVVSDIMSDRAARSITFGLASSLTTPFWSAVKTGTSKALRDNWCIGYTDRYTVGVWVGNFEGDSMRGVSGVTGAATVWHDIMMALHRDDPSQKPTQPEGLDLRMVQFDPGIEPPRQEIFLTGTDSATIATVNQEITQARILSPSNGTIIALDPDIPDVRQKVAFVVGGSATSLRLRLNGKILSDDGLRWTPQPGYHELALVDADNKTIDSVRFTVRGPY